MYDLRSHLKEYRDAGALHTLVALDSVIDEHLFVTKSGDLVAFLKFCGVDPECLDVADKEAVTRRFEAAHRLFDDRFRVYQYLFKREHPILSASINANPVVNEAVQNRLRHFNQRPEPLYWVDTALAVVYEGWREGHVMNNLQTGGGLLSPFVRAFSAAEKSAVLSESLDQSRELVLGKVNAFVTQLRDFLDIELLGTGAAFQIQRRLLNYASIKCDYARLTGHHFVDYQACGSHLECHRDFLRLDDDYIAVLTLKEPPPQTYALMLANLESLPCPFVVASEWKRWDSGKIRRMIQSRRRHFHNSKSSLGAQLSVTPQSGAADVLVDNAAVAMVGNLGACLEELDFKGRHFGEYSLSIFLYEKDPAALRRAVAQCLKTFAAHDAQLTEERYNRLSAWLAGQAGNSRFNLRRMWLTDTNYADLSLLFSPANGDARNQHLDREYLAVFEGRGNSPYFFNFHFQDVGHTFIIGATGSGKSFLLNFLLTHVQKYAPLIRIFDLGGSYESLTRLLGGSYLPVHAAKRSFTINPFCLPPTPENLLFLFAWVKVLIGSDLAADEEQDLYEQIENLYHVAPEQRRLSTLAKILPQKLHRAFQRWTEGGVYGWLFDNAEDTLTLSSIQTFDFEGMTDAKDTLEPLLFYVLHRANAAIADDPAQLKVFVMDESWRFFAHPVIKAYMIEALKTWRKKNACLILATQSVGDLTSSAMLPVVMESCPTQVFLANKRMDREMYQQAFHLNDREIELIAGLEAKKEFLLKRPDHSKVLRLDVSPKEYWIYTNNSSDTARKREVFAHLGFEAGLEQLAKENR